MDVLLGKSVLRWRLHPLTVLSRYYSWMGSSSVRRDILSQYRQEKLQLGITSRGRRGRRGRRSPKEADTPRNATASATHSRAAPQPAHSGSDKENTHTKHGDHDVDDKDEFFDAEDASLDDMD